MPPTKKHGTDMYAAHASPTKRGSFNARGHSEITVMPKTVAVGAFSQSQTQNNEPNPSV